uniref:Uncharacterized protein n=1 Tax=Lotharella globosa TaxID=91324 RepID=A0A7S3ZHT1_9EUKA
MAFSTSARFNYKTRKQVPGPRYDHLKAFQKYDSRIKRTAAYSFNQFRRFNPDPKNSHPGLVYSPDEQKVQEAAKTTVFPTGKRFKYSRPKSPGPKYDTSKQEKIRIQYPKAVFGTDDRFKELRPSRFPGPRYDVYRGMAQTKQRATGTRFGDAARVVNFGSSIAPGPAYNPSDHYTTRIRTAPTAAFGSAKRWSTKVKRIYGGSHFTLIAYD